jgi:undecaprenyl-diphosphatase
LLVTLAATSVVVASAKALAGRVRPCHTHAWLHALPIALPTDPSFPSGHAAGSFAFAAFVFTTHRRAGFALSCVALLIALSRVALGVHYPSDVAAGALLGTLLGWAGARCSAAVRPLPDANPEAVGQ